MPTSTTNYGWQKPNVNDPVDANLWGGYLNGNLDAQDTLIKTLSDNIASVTGGNITATTAPINGFYKPATNTVALATNSVEKWRVDATGNVGMGITPDGSARLHMLGGGINMGVASAGGNPLYLYRNSTTNYARLNTNAAGDVTLQTGTSTPATRWTVTAAGDATFTNVVSAPGFLPTGAAGSVGTFMLAVTGTAVGFGGTVPGSALRPTGAGGSNPGSPQTGTWQCLGTASSGSVTLFVRIA